MRSRSNQLRPTLHLTGKETIIRPSEVKGSFKVSELMVQRTTSKVVERTTTRS